MADSIERCRENMFLLYPDVREFVFASVSTTRGEDVVTVVVI